MRRIAGLSNKKPLRKPAAKVRKAPPRVAGRRRKAARKRPARQLFTNDLFGAVFKAIAPQELKVWSRHFPAHMRADLQTPLDALMASADYCVGAMPRYRSEIRPVDLMNEPTCFRMMKFLIRQHLEAKLVTVTALAASSGAPYATAMRRVNEMVKRGYVVHHPRTRTGKSFSLHPSPQLMGAWCDYTRRLKRVISRTLGRPISKQVRQPLP